MEILFFTLGESTALLSYLCKIQYLILALTETFRNSIKEEAFQEAFQEAFLIRSAYLPCVLNFGVVTKKGAFPSNTLLRFEKTRQY